MSLYTYFVLLPYIFVNYSTVIHITSATRPHHIYCARNALFSCGLPPELEEYFRKRVLCYNNPEPSSPSVPLADVFPIQDLNKKPSQSMCVGIPVLKCVSTAL